MGSGEAISIRDLARVAAEEIRPGLAVHVDRTPLAGAPLQQYVPDIRKAENELGLHQTVGLRDAIRRTAGWYR